MTPTSFTAIRNEIINQNIPYPQIPETTYSASQKATINISSQSDFDALHQSIDALIGTKKCIHVIFDGGTYFFHDNNNYNAHVKLDAPVLSNVEIHFVGNGSTLIGRNSALSSPTYENGRFKYSVAVSDHIYNQILVDNNGEFVADFYGPMHVLREGESITVGINEIRIPHHLEQAIDVNSNDIYIQIFSTYFAQIYKVIEYDDPYIVASSSPETGTYMLTTYPDIYTPVQNSRPYLSSAYFRPCFRLINNPSEYTKAYYKDGYLYSLRNDVTLCDATTFLKVLTSPKVLTVSGFKFKGNKAIDTDSKYLINIYNSNGWVVVRDCEFTNIKSTIFKAHTCSSLLFQNNICSHYYKKCVNTMVCSDVHVLQNTISDGNLHYENFSAIDCFNSGCHIAYNKLKNYGYGGISVGTYYTAETLTEELAIVEYNELYMTPEYRNSFECVPQMDGGAIYAQTKHYRTVIRYNFISGYHGAFKSRSIYCDEGTQNTWIYGNMMINNKDYYALDLRYVNITGVDHNIRNRMLYNIMDAHYRFEGRSDIDITGTDDSLKNVKGRNIIITERYSPSSYIVVNDINTAKKESDTFLSGCKIEEYGIALPIGQKGQIDVLGLPEFICSHLRYDYY